MRVGRIADLGSIKDPNLVAILRSLITAVDGNLEVSDNLRARIIRGVFFKTPNTDVAVKHNLGKATQDFLFLGGIGGFARFRRGKTPPTVDRLWIQCDTAGITADFLILV